MIPFDYDDLPPLPIHIVRRPPDLPIKLVDPTLTGKTTNFIERMARLEYSKRTITSSYSVALAALACNYSRCPEQIAVASSLLSQVGHIVPDNLQGTMTHLRDLSSNIIYDRPFEAEEVMAMTHLPSATIQEFLSMTAPYHKTRVNFATFEKFCEGYPGVGIKRSLSKIKISYEHIRVVGTKQICGSYQWDYPQQLLDKLTYSKAKYVTTGSVLADFLLYSFCTHYEVRNARAASRLQVSVHERKNPDGTQVLHALESESSILGMLKMKAVFSLLKKKLEETELTFWAPTDLLSSVMQYLGDLALAVTYEGKEELLASLKSIHHEEVLIAPVSCIDTSSVLLASQLAPNDSIVPHVVPNMHNAMKHTRKSLIGPSMLLDNNDPSTSGSDHLRSWFDICKTIATSLADHTDLRVVHVTNVNKAATSSAIKEKFPLTTVIELKAGELLENVRLPACDIILCDYLYKEVEHVTPISLDAFTSKQSEVVSNMLNVATRSEAKFVAAKCFSLTGMVSYDYVRSVFSPIMASRPHIGAWECRESGLTGVILSISTWRLQNTIRWPPDKLGSLARGLQECVGQYAVSRANYVLGQLSCGIVVSNLGYDPRRPEELDDIIATHITDMSHVHPVNMGSNSRQVCRASLRKFLLASQ